MAPSEQEGDGLVNRGLLPKGAGVCVRALGRALIEASIDRACFSTPHIEEGVFLTHMLLTDSDSRVWVKPRGTFGARI